MTSDRVTSPDPTPIPAEARQAARRAYHAAHLLAESPVDRAIDSAFAAGLAAVRTRSGCCQAAVDSDGHSHAETCVYLLGLREGRVEGRTAAAADIRREFALTHHPVSVVRLIAGRAARVAEHGPQSGADR